MAGTAAGSAGAGALILDIHSGSRTVGIDSLAGAAVTGHIDGLTVNGYGCRRR